MASRTASSTSTTPLLGPVDLVGQLRYITFAEVREAAGGASGNARSSSRRFAPGASGEGSRPGTERAARPPSDTHGHVVDRHLLARREVARPPAFLVGELVAEAHVREGPAELRVSAGHQS